MKLNNSLITIKGILNHKKDSLFSFYNNSYPRKKNFLKKNWKWLYRINFSPNSTPKIFLLDKEIISHSGYIPFHIKIKNNKYLASWFVDFVVSNKHRKKGVGSNMAKTWIKDIDIGLTFCNKKALKVFKDNNWDTNFKFFTTIVPIKPLKYKKFNIPFKNFFDNFFFYLFSKFNKISKKQSSIFLYDLSIKSINNLCDINNSKKTIKPIRDKNYFKWRILNSPFKNKYLIASDKSKKNFFLIKENIINKYKYLEILLKPHEINSDGLRNFILEISKWAYRNNYIYIKFLMNEKEIKDLNLFFLYKRKLNFAFFFKKKIKNPYFQFDLIDSDFEFTNV